MSELPSRLIDVDAVRHAITDIAALTRTEERAQLYRVLRIILEPMRRLVTLDRLVADAEGSEITGRDRLLRYLSDPGGDAKLHSRGGALRPPNDEPVDVTEPDGAGVIDERRLQVVTSSLASIALQGSPSGAAQAVDAVLPLVGGARLLEAIVQGHRLGGAEGALAPLRSGDMPGMPGDLQDLIGGLRFDAVGMPELEVPDFELPDFGVPHIDRDWLDDIFDPFDNPFDDLWTDPDAWEPVPEWWEISPPEQDIPPGLAAQIACIMTVSRLISERAAIPPPTMPAGSPYGMVWADQITSLDPSAHCPEDVLNIYGSGFAALRAAAVLVLPTASGCRVVAVQAHNWTDTRIRVSLPADVVSGPVGFADSNYVKAYDAWHAEQKRLLDAIRGYRCAGFAPVVVETKPFSVCAPNLGRNYLTAGAAIIDSFTADGAGRLVVAPGGNVTLAWSTRNCTGVVVTRTSAYGPAFPGSVSTTGVPIGSVTVGPFSASSPLDATYELRATGPCGLVTATVTVAIRKTPRLHVVGIEFTQGIQAFGKFASPNSASPLVADKDTIARVYVTHDLDSYLLDSKYGVPVSGRLRVGGISISPLNVGDALPSEGWINRASTNHSLNFRIPAGLAHGVGSIGTTVWTTAQFEQPPAGELLRPSTTFSSSVTWTPRRALRLRYVRVSAPGVPALSDAACRDIIVRAHDLLPSPPLDIAPARMPTWHTSANPMTSDGKQTVLDHLDDQHDCTLSEAIFPWEDDCPPSDGAIWIGVLPVDAGGLAQSHRVFAPGRNTLVAQANRITVAHEIGHTQKLNHVNPGVSCGSGGPDGDYDSLPGGGSIPSADAFDPNGGVSLPVPGGFLWDMMTYGCNRWISRSNWQRLFDKLS